MHSLVVWSVTKKQYRAWLRVETFNGTQKVLQIVYLPGSKAMWTYDVSDQEILMNKTKKMNENFLCEK